MPPTGFKRSRALWDNARRENDVAPASDKFMRVLRAVLYELQPIRFDELDTQTWIHRCRVVCKSVVSFAGTTVPSWSRIVMEFCRTMTLKQWTMVGAVVCYYGAVRWIHHALEAGPVVIIITALVAIFTIGLGDNENDGLSAYSAFNRGFQQIMGSVDAEALLQQHVGGAMAMPMNNFGRAREDELEGARPPPARHERRRQQQQQDQDREDGRQQEQPPADDSDSEDYDDDDEDDAPAQAQPRARTTGKKARRRNLELRREMKRQREAAQAMGFGGQQQEDVVAMQRLVEDQVMGAADQAEND
jgi:hypothetical protein